jgi:membrane-associated phospholipid phosphatase
MGTRYLFSCKHLRHKALTCTLCLVGTLMVFASTLLTKQHVLIDVLGGIAVSEIGWLVARYTKLPQKLEPLAQAFPQTKLGKLL